MDLDGDARLDLVILNYVVFGPNSQQYCELRPASSPLARPRSTRRNTAKSGETPAKASVSSWCPIRSA